MYEVEYVKSIVKTFTYNGVEYSNDYLKEHATAMFTKVIAAASSNEKEKFSALVACLGINEEKANKIWIIAKPLLKWLDKLTIKKAARIMNFISFGKAIDKNAANEIADTKVKDVVFATFHSILDGSLIKHEEGSACSEHTTMEGHTHTYACHCKLRYTSLEERTAEVALHECMCLIEESVSLV